MKKILNYCLLSLACSLTALSSHASSEPSSSDNMASLIKNGHLFLQLGGYQGIQGKQQHIDIPSLIGDDFSVNDRRDENILLGLGYYIDGQERAFYKLSYGLNLFYLAQMQVTGNVTQEGLFQNLSYKYNVSNLPLFLMARSEFLTSYPNYHLTADVGLGPNFMFLSNFSEQAINPVSVPDSPFSSRTSTNLAGTFGLGIKFNNLINNKSLECGYRFFYLGNGNFNHNVQVSNSLETGSTYTNAVICSLSF